MLYFQGFKHVHFVDLMWPLGAPGPPWGEMVRPRDAPGGSQGTGFRPEGGPGGALESANERFGAAWFFHRR